MCCATGLPLARRRVAGKGSAAVATSSSTARWCGRVSCWPGRPRVVGSRRSRDCPGRSPAARAQRALVEHGGVQCGFCTPGMVVLTRLLTDKPAPTRDEVADAIGGNICRCTGYGKIVDAMVALSAQDVVNGSDLDAGGLRLVGRRVPRLDGASKAAGRAVTSTISCSHSCSTPASSGVPWPTLGWSRPKRRRPRLVPTSRSCCRPSRPDCRRWDIRSGVP